MGSGVEKLANETRNVSAPTDYDGVQSSEACELAVVHDDEKSDEFSGTNDNQEVSKSDTPAASSQTSEVSPYLTGLRLAALFLGILLIGFLIGLDQSIVSTAIPKLVSEFDALEQVPWVSSAYLLTQPSFMLTWGQIITVADIKWTSIIGVVIFEIGNALCGAAPNIDVLIFGRALAGMGISGATVSSFVLIGRIAPIEQRGVLINFMASIFLFSSVAGPLVGGAFTDSPALTWRWCFYINIPFGAVAILILLLLVKPEHSIPRPPGSSTSLWRRLATLDWIGSTLCLGAAVALLLPLQWGGVSKRWGDPVVIACLCVFVVVFVVFILWELYQKGRAILPLPLFSSKTMIGSCLAGFLIQITFSVANYWLPLYYQGVLLRSAVRSGIDTFSFMATSVTFALLAGLIIGKVGRPLPFLVFSPLLATLGTGLLYWSFTMQPRQSVAHIILFQAMLGIGLGGAIQNTMVVIHAEFDKDPRKLAQSASVLNASKWIGGAVGLAGAGAIFGNTLRTEIAKDAPDLTAETVAAVRQSVLVIQTLSKTDQQNVMRAYSSALGYVFAFLIPSSVLASLAAAVFIRNFDLRKKRSPPAPTASENAA